MVRYLVRDGYLDKPLLRDAFLRVDRRDFLPPQLQPYAYEDRPLPIGSDQTISQPEVVAFMLELLDPQPGEKILDVGSGSGWQTALLAHIVEEDGLVVAIEIVPELYELSKRNCAKYGFRNIEFIRGDATVAQKPEGFFDRIIVAASARIGVPDALKKQLRVGGRLVIPVRDSIYSMRKISSDYFIEKEYPGFLFVPLIST
jgi:protein-L-isoaspartate(D-aspartate) O-methyltransferase